MNSTHFEKIIMEMGENPKRQGLLKTPKRAANAFKFLTNGYSQSLDRIVNGALFESTADEMVVIDNIEFYSLCEHHLLPFSGVCHVAYLPTGKVLGLSKVARIVDMYSLRLQIQEELTKNIAQAIMSVTQAKGVGVILEAKHFCMMMRGVKKQQSGMKTSCMLGEFQNSPNVRNEFLSLIGK